MAHNFKKAIVIGGSKGIGAQISQHIKSLKIKTISCSRKEIDTTSLESVNNFLKKHKSTDVLVLNSGGPPALKFEKIKITDWKKYFNQLFLSYVVLLQKIKILKNFLANLFWKESFIMPKKVNYLTIFMYPPIQL